MKLLRYGALGSEKPGCLDSQGNIRDLSQIIPDIAGEVLLPEGLAALRKCDVNNLPLVQSNPRLGSCVGGVGKVICIGLNYAEHAAETGLISFSDPIFFLKATSAICGAHDDLIIPRNSNQTDWEVELGVVIGTQAKHVTEADAMNYVAGFTVINDVSEREWQFKTSQWTRGKNCDSFCPIGPWLVTRDEIADPQQLSIWCEVDGKRYQNGRTSQMIFSIAKIISHLSDAFTLYPGDVISTGTPAGSGIGQKPNPIFLKPGQIVHLGIEGLGEQKHLTVNESPT